jgi:hypothetical protein
VFGSPGQFLENAAGQKRDKTRGFATNTNANFLKVGPTKKKQNRLI